MSYDIQVTPTSRYLEDQSEPDQSVYVFAYTITIKNKGNKAAQLVSRKWRIKDDLGHEQTVEGPGVVGQQPNIAPGGVYEYTSGSVLPTSFGTMEGCYQMIGEDGTLFETTIPTFVLSTPRILH
jgi:ApaG protein